jgi:hypothetical protein
MQRLLHLKSGSSGAGSGASNGQPSPSRSLERSLVLDSDARDAAASDLQQGLPHTQAPATAYRSPTKQLRNLWGKLGSTMKKGRRSSAASGGDASSGAGSPGAPELRGGHMPQPRGAGSIDLDSQASAGEAAVGVPPGATDTPVLLHGGADAVGASCGESYYSYSPARSCSTGSSPFIPQHVYYDQTLDLRQVRGRPWRTLEVSFCAAARCVPAHTAVPLTNRSPLMMPAYVHTHTCIYCS